MISSSFAKAPLPTNLIYPPTGTDTGRASAWNSILAAAPAEAALYLAAGRFIAIENRNGGADMKTGQWIVGRGPAETTYTILNHSSSVSDYTLISYELGATRTKVQGLLLDCNSENQIYPAATYGIFAETINQVKAVHWASLAAAEAFILSADTVSDCEVTEPYAVIHTDGSTCIQAKQGAYRNYVHGVSASATGVGPAYCNGLSPNWGDGVEYADNRVEIGGTNGIGIYVDSTSLNNFTSRRDKLACIQGVRLIGAGPFTNLHFIDTEFSIPDVGVPGVFDYADGYGVFIHPEDNPIGRPGVVAAATNIRFTNCRFLNRAGVAKANSPKAWYFGVNANTIHVENCVFDVETPALGAKLASQSGNTNLAGTPITIV